MSQAIRFIIDPGEKVRCNGCGLMIEPAECMKLVYLVRLDEEDTLLYPRCEACYNEETTKQEEVQA